MNTKIDELIEKYEVIVCENNEFSTAGLFKDGKKAGTTIVSHEIINDLKQLKEALDKKVEVSKELAEWYEVRKDHTLKHKIQDAECSRNEFIKNWYDTCKGRHRYSRANAQEVLAKMDLFGYTVAKEPNWIVVSPNNCYFLSFDSGNGDGYGDCLAYAGITDKNQACKFYEKSKADAVATLIGGTTVEVEELG